MGGSQYLSLAVILGGFSTAAYGVSEVIAAASRWEQPYAAQRERKGCALTVIGLLIAMCVVAVEFAGG